MSKIAWTDVVAFAATLTSVNEEAQVDILAYVHDRVSVDEFGGEESPTLRLARIFFAAHLGSMPQQGSTGAVGPVVSESVGGLSRSYAQLNNASDSLSSTTYGQQFVELCRRTAMRAGDVL